MKRLQRLIDNLTISAALKEGLRAYFEQAQALQSLEAENQHLDREVGRMAEKVVKAEERYAETAADLHSVRERRDQLSRDLSKLIDERNAYFSEVQTLRENLDAITKEFQTFRKDTARTIQILKEHGETLREKCEINRKSSDEETERAAKLEGQLEQAKRTLADVEALLERETGRREYVEGRLEFTLKQLDALQAPIRETDTETAAETTEGN